MSSFFSPYRHQFVRVGACVPQVAVAEPARNGDQALALLRDGDAAGIALMVFPELSLSAYSIDDLLFQDAVLDAVEAQIERLVAASENLRSVFVVGAPLRRQGRLYNCAVAIHRGQVLGVVPKIFLPNYREFYERRHFTSGEGVRGGSIAVAGHEAPFGSDLLFAAEGVAGVHVPCRDLRGPVGALAAEHRRGARRRGNPPQPVGQQYHDRKGEDAARFLCASQSARCIAAYAYSAAGPGESTTDLAWDGQAGIFEIGESLARPALPAGPEIAVADVDIGRIRQERMRTNTFGDNARRPMRQNAPAFRRDRVRLRAAEPACSICAARSSASRSCRPTRRCSRDNCYEAYNIQVQGLAQRLKATGLEQLVIGVSGGLDSTQALIVSARVMDSARPAARQHPGLHAARLRDEQRHQGQCLAADARARRHRRGDRHPPGRQADAGRYRPCLRARAKRSTT